MIRTNDGRVTGLLVVLVLGALAAVLLCFGILPSCGTVGGWLGAPAGQSAPPAATNSTGSEQVTFHIPGGGILTMPVAPASKTVWHVPGVGDVTIDPTTAAPPTGAPAGTSPSSSTSGTQPGSAQPSATLGPTNADAVGDAGGGVVGMLTGNPLLGILAATALKELLAKMIPARKPPPDASAAPAGTPA